MSDQENPTTLSEIDEAKFLNDAKMLAIHARSGDEIARHQGYPTLRGMDAVHRYLIDKYHWLPSQVRTLSVEDLDLLLDGYRHPD